MWRTLLIDHNWPDFLWDNSDTCPSPCIDFTILAKHCILIMSQVLIRNVLVLQYWTIRTWTMATAHWRWSLLLFQTLIKGSLCLFYTIQDLFGLTFPKHIRRTVQRFCETITTTYHSFRAIALFSRMIIACSNSDHKLFTWESIAETFFLSYSRVLFIIVIWLSRVFKCFSRSGSLKCTWWLILFIQQFH